MGHAVVDVGAPSTPETYISSDGITLMLAACVKQAFTDYLGTDEKQKQTAAAFLLRAGFLLPNGDIDWHGFTPRQPRAPRRASRGQGRKETNG